jgi:hypothetical protein
MLAILQLVIADLVEFVVSEWRQLRQQTSQPIKALPREAELAYAHDVLQSEALSSAPTAVSPIVHEEAKEVALSQPAPVVETRAVALPDVVQPLLLPEAVTVPNYAQLAATEAESATMVVSELYPVSMYVVEEGGAPLFTSARVGFDERLFQVPYGQVVTVQSYEGKYAYVLVHGQVGFIAKDQLTPHKTDVWPALTPKTQYLADTPATIFVRKLLRDPFLAGYLSMPLQPGEYILLRLKQDSLTLPWPDVSTQPRVPGVWHQLLRGIRGIHTTVMPLTDSIMEWIAEDGEGRLAYVEAVLPDRTLRVSAVGMVVEGEYGEITLPESVWREWRPVFMEVA